MAEPLVNQFGPAVPKKIGAMLSDVGKFDASAFVATALDGYHSLNLMQRAVKIADALQVHLPANYAKAIKLLLASVGAPLQTTGGNGMTPFLYLPHTLFVARHGLEHFELSMQAQYVLTQRFTAEFSIRPFIERYPQQCLALLKTWARDDNEHVRRLGVRRHATTLALGRTIAVVSEGSCTGSRLTGVAQGRPRTLRATFSGQQPE